MHTLMEALNEFDGLKNSTIIDNFIKCWSIINNRGFKNIGCSISGGSDSDVMLDIIAKCDKDKKVNYYFFDTGIEYKATKEHLDYLENKYDIKIKRENAIEPIPLSCKNHGQPFMNKGAAERIERLQKKGFDFKDYDFEYMKDHYGKALAMWWFSKYPVERLNINYNKYLKEFLIAHPPTFKISNKCCDLAKKNVSKYLVKKYNLDLMCIGVRKAEGGTRSIAYKSCFDEESKIGCAQYRPIFWYSDFDKKDYELNQNILHSKCYTEYGFERTGCACCPFCHVKNKLNNELEITEKYEPLLYKAVNNIFKDSYEYTKLYYDFRAEMDEKKDVIEGQTTIFDFY